MGFPIQKAGLWIGMKFLKAVVLCGHAESIPVNYPCRVLPQNTFFFFPSELLPSVLHP